MWKQKLLLMALIVHMVKSNITNASCIFTDGGLSANCDNFDDFGNITQEAAKNTKYFYLVGKGDKDKEFPPDFNGQFWPNILNVNIGPSHKMKCQEILDLTWKFPELGQISFKNCTGAQPVTQCSSENEVVLPEACSLSENGTKLECTSLENFERFDDGLAKDIKKIVFRDFKAQKMPKLMKEKWGNLEDISLSGLEEVFCEDVINIGSNIVNLEKVTFKKCLKKPLNVKCDI